MDKRQNFIACTRKNLLQPRNTSDIRQKKIQNTRNEPEEIRDRAGDNRQNKAADRRQNQTKRQVNRQKRLGSLKEKQMSRDRG